MPFGFDNDWRRLGRILTLTLACLFGAECLAFQNGQGVRILDNRFRIDHEVESITLIVQRESGSAPVVVVQPDGSKWYSHRHPDTVRWNVSQSSDMIQITQPTPGPWQLLGKVTEGSELHMISGITLIADPLPQQVYRGQRVKLLAQLQGDDERIAMPEFNSQLDWKIELASANRTGDENYGFETVFIGDYLDNGHFLDERPDDGWFTSRLDFNYPAGLYDVTLSVENRVFRRERQQQIEILPQPVRLFLPKGATGDFSEYHLKLLVEPEVLPENVHINLHVYRPNQQRESIAITPTDYLQSIPLPMVTEYGNYLIEGEAAGTRLDGHEFFLKLPAVSFYIAPPPTLESSEQTNEIDYEERMAMAAAREEEARSRVVTVIVLVNLLLIGVGGALLVYWRKRQVLINQLLAEPSATEELSPENVDLTRLS